MARVRKSRGSAVSGFSAGEARFILDSLVREGKVSADSLRDARAKHADAIRTYMDRLKELGVEVSHAGSSMAAAGAEAIAEAGESVKSAGAAAAKTVRRVARRAKAAITPERELTRKFQGQFLGLSRAISDVKVKADFSERYKAVSGPAKQGVIDAMRAYVDKAKTSSKRGASAARAGRKRATRRRRK